MIGKMLLRLYPAVWRKEYGEEFAEMLSSRPLTLQAIANVSLSALRQRWRYAPPWLLSGAFQFFSIATWIVLQFLGLLSPLGVRLIIPIAILLQFGTGVWIATRRNGGFVAGLVGTIGAALVAYLPFLLALLLASPPPDFPDRTLLIHMNHVNAGRLFVLVMVCAATCGCFGAICGSMIKIRPRKES